MHNFVLSTSLALVSMLASAQASLGSVQEPSGASTQEKIAAILAEDWAAKLTVERRVDGDAAVLNRLQAELAVLKGAAAAAPERVLEGLERAIGLLEAQLPKAEPKSVLAHQQNALESQSMKEVVKDSLTYPKLHTLERLGPSISHILEELVLEATHPSQLARYPQNPFEWLLRADEARGVAVAEILLQRQGRGWAGVLAEGVDKWVSLDKSGGVAAIEASPAFAVAMQIAESSEVNGRTRLAIIKKYLYGGVQGERLAALARKEWSSVARDRAIMGDPQGWLVRRWLEDEDPKVRRRTAETLFNSSKELEALELLIENTDPQVRAWAVAGISDHVLENIRPSPRVTALWDRALADPNPKVREAAYEMLAGSYRNGVLTVLGPDEYLQLVHKLREPEEQALAGELIRWIDLPLQTACTTGGYGRMMAALAQSGLRELNPELLNSLNRMSSAPRNLDEFIEAIDWGKDWGEPVGFVRSNRGLLERLPFEIRLMRFASWVKRPPLPGHYLHQLFPSEDLESPISVAGLGVQEAVALVLNERAFDGGWTAHFLLGTDWSGMVAELEKASRDGALSLRQRLLAKLALATAGDLPGGNVAAIAKDLVALEQTKGGADPHLALAPVLARLTPRRSAQRRELFAALLADPGVPSRVLGEFGRLGIDDAAAPSTQVAGILDGLVSRQGRDRGLDAVGFEGLADECLLRMQAEPALFREPLVTGWMQDSTRFVRCSSAVVAAGRGDLLPAMREVVFAEMDGTEYTPSLSEALNALSAHPGPELTEALLDFAERAQSANARRMTMERIRMWIEIADLGSQLDREMEGPTRESALVELVALLEDPQEVVRVEAIRSLATLGAVEHLPRLIGFLTSPSEAERAAARIALDTLHGQAVR